MRVSNHTITKYSGREHAH